MDGPTGGIEGFGGTMARQPGPGSNFDRSGPYSTAWGGGGGGGSSVRRMPQQGSRDGGGNRSQQLQVRALAPTGTAPGDVQHNGAGPVTVQRERPHILPEGYYAPEEVEQWL